MVVESTALYFRNGSSDKEYHASIDRRVGGFVVNFAYGRRGSTLNAGTKTLAPVTLVEAQSIYEKLVRSKEAKGYTAQGDGKAFAGTDKAGKVSNMSSGVQLLNPIDNERLKELLWDNNWGEQEKKNGKRIQVRVKNGDVEASNRRGLIVGIPEEVVDSLKGLRDCQLDGELVGDMYYVFDMLRTEGTDLTATGFENRYTSLVGFKKRNRKSWGPNVEIMPVMYGGTHKTELFERCKASNLEGVVFKRLNSIYVAGRPNSEGDQLKYKFWESASVVVSKVNQKRSVGFTCGGTFVGNVTIPEKYEIPEVGTVIEVKYLYWHKGGSLFEPSYLGPREDIGPDDCTIDQLKVKGE